MKMLVLMACICTCGCGLSPHYVEVMQQVNNIMDNQIMYMKGVQEQNEKYSKQMHMSLDNAFANDLEAYQGEYSKSWILEAVKAYTVTRDAISEQFRLQSIQNEKMVRQLQLAIQANEDLAKLIKVENTRWENLGFTNLRNGLVTRTVSEVFVE